VDGFGVIVVSHFLECALARHLTAALRPDGLLFYQTFTRCHVDDGGPLNAGFLLRDHGLLADVPITLPRGLSRGEASGEYGAGLA
jgi:tellurite methyltransferase